jgi:hypothetical protein
MSTIPMLVKSQCYYGGKIRSVDSIVDYDMDDRGKDENGNRTIMPAWGEPVKGQEPKEAEPVKTEFAETTLHAIAQKPAPKVRTANIRKKAKKKSKTKNIKAKEPVLAKQEELPSENRE